MALIPTALPVSSQPWKLAKSQFLQGLSGSERSMFSSATLENLFYQSSVDSIQEYGVALDVYSNASSTIIFPLWGSIRVVLTLARGFGKYFEKLEDMFSRISDVLPRFRIYEQLFPDHERPLSALTKSYLDIIIFCVDAKELFGKARRSTVTWAVIGHVLWRNFDQKFSTNHLLQFIQHQKLVEKEAGLSEMMEAIIARKIAEANQLAQANVRLDMKRRQLLSVLSTVDYAAQHRRLRHLRHKGTCNWLLRDVGFRSWLHAQTSSCFACYGIPGSGKTVLSASIAEELSPILSEPQFGMCYYYCDYSDVKSLDASTVIGTLIRQLLEKNDIPEDVEARLLSLYNGSSVAPSLHSLLDVFERTLKLFSTCLIVIDGLDELPRESQFTMYPLASSRSEENDIRRALRGLHFHSIEISADNISSDIRAFINDEVGTRIKQGRLTLGSLSVKDEILQALTVGAKDMFLWVKFQLEDLCGATSDKEIRNILRDLPKDLVETYGRIITKIRASGPGRIKLARKMLKWIICARRPLRIEELREAMALDLTDSHFDEDKLPSGDNWRLIQMCGNLAVLNRDDNTVRLAHHTVQQFLLTQSDLLYTDVSVPGYLTLPDIEIEIGQLCVAYLCLSDFETQVARCEMFTVAAGTDVLQSFVYSQLPVTNVFGKFASTIMSAVWTESPIERRPVAVDLSTYKPEQHVKRSMQD
ncbi:hypothetical protein Vi05172_g13629 [Venturia inaequalis]|nr:hypothetical protein Vi05172_g13629 [Venturia inaequalis]